MLEITASPKAHTIGTEPVRLAALLNGFEVRRARVSSAAINTGKLTLAFDGSEIPLLPGESLELGSAASQYTVRAEGDAGVVEVSYVREVDPQ